MVYSGGTSTYLKVSKLSITYLIILSLDELVHEEVFSKSKCSGC